MPTFSHLVKILLCSFLFINTIWAVTELPTDIDPIQLEKDLKPDFKQNTIASPSIEQPIEPKLELPASYHVNNIVLTNIKLDGNFSLTESQFSNYYKHLYGQKISLATLYLIAEQITNKYRASGYVFSSAIIPEQQISDGIVTIKIIEGYISKINLTGAIVENVIVQQIVEKIYAIKPFNINNFERYMLLLNGLPGLSAKAVFKKSQLYNVAPGSIELDLVFTSFLNTKFNASVSNNIANYLGSFVTSFNIEKVNSLFNNHSTSFNVSVVNNIKPLQLFSLIEKIILNSEGTSLFITGDLTRIKPIAQLNSNNVKIFSTSLSFNITHPYIHSRLQNFTPFIGININNTRTEIASFLNNKDRTRSISFGGNYDFYDSYNGINLFSLNLTKGLDMLNSSKRLLYPSKEYGQVEFFKTILNISHQQILTKAVSIYTTINTQYTKDTLLSSEVFSFGGSSIGRGYNSSALSGDQGYSFTNELRYGLAKIDFLSTEFFIFHDYGKAWNHRKPLIKNVKAISYGTGVRFNIGPYSSAQLSLAQPLTRKVFQEANYRNRRPTQLFFSLYFRM